MGLSNYKKMIDRQIMRDLESLISQNPHITTSELSIKTKLSSLTIQNRLKANGYKLVWRKE
jgi:hypothetical protein